MFATKDFEMLVLELGIRVAFRLAWVDWPKVDWREALNEVARRQGILTRR